MKVKINCSGCRVNCCWNRHLTPTLLPSETENFKDNLKVLDTPFGNISILKKKNNGACIFLDEKAMACKIYNKRPLECQLYPLLLDFSKKLPNIKLDKRFCKNIKELTFSRKIIIDSIRKNNFPKDWVRAYLTLEDY